MGLSRSTTSSACSASWSSGLDYVRASFGIALPDNRQYRGLVDRLPALAKERLRLAVFWVSREGDELIVEVDS